MHMLSVNLESMQVFAFVPQVPLPKGKADIKYRKLNFSLGYRMVEGVRRRQEG